MLARMSSCAKASRELNPHRNWVRPPTVSEQMPNGYILHFILYLVQEFFGLASTYQSHRTGAGQPPHYPEMMTAVLLLACSSGIRPSRSITKACEESLDYLAITDRRKPDQRFFARFYKRHRKALSGQFDQMEGPCHKLKMFSLCLVTVDGAMIQVNVSKYRVMSFDREEGRMAKLRATVWEWYVLGVREDEVEDVSNGDEFHGDEMPDWVVGKTRRSNKIEKSKKKLDDRAVVSFVSSGDSRQTGEPSLAVPMKGAQWIFTNSEGQIVPYKGGPYRTSAHKWQ